MLAVNKMLLALTILFIPFIASIGETGILGGMGTHLSFYPSFVMLFLFLVRCFVKHSKIIVPNTLSFSFLMLFALWILLSGIVNIPYLLSLEFKGTIGISRFIIQVGTFFIFLSFSVVFFNYIVKLQNDMEFLEKYLLYSFAIAGAYSLLEILLIVDFSTMKDIISAVNFFRGSGGERIYFGRIRSVASEASNFGMYAGIIMPWLIMKWLTAYKYKLFWGGASIYLLLLVILSFSRTAYFIIAIEMCVMFFLFSKEFKKNMRQMVVFGVVIMIGVFWILNQMEKLPFFDTMGVITSFLDNSADNKYLTSDLTRLGSQYAALKIFLENPFCGVGYGAFGFYASDYYPQEAWNSWEIQELGSNSTNSAWPPVYGIHARILAELGIPGEICWLGFWGCLLYGLYKNSKNVDDEVLKMRIRAVLVSIIGCVLFGFNIDAFAVIVLWVLAAFSWSIIQKKSDGINQFGENNE